MIFLELQKMIDFKMWFGAQLLFVVSAAEHLAEVRAREGRKKEGRTCWGIEQCLRNPLTSNLLWRNTKRQHKKLTDFNPTYKMRLQILTRISSCQIEEAFHCWKEHRSRKIGSIPSQNAMTKMKTKDILSFVLFYFSNFHFFFLFFSIPRSLQEADCPDFNSELLVCSTNIHGGNVHDGQTRGLLRSVLDHCLAPLSRVFLCRGENTMAVKWAVTFSKIAENDIGLVSEHRATSDVCMREE